MKVFLFVLNRVSKKLVLNFHVTLMSVMFFSGYVFASPPDQSPVSLWIVIPVGCLILSEFVSFFTGTWRTILEN